MQDAFLLRVAGPDRVVVCLDDTSAVVEMQLSRGLTPAEMARARSGVSPLIPLRVRVRVSPADYADQVFWRSDMEAEWPSVQARRPCIRKRKLAD